MSLTRHEIEAFSVTLSHLARQVERLTAIAESTLAEVRKRVEHPRRLRRDNALLRTRIVELKAENQKMHKLLDQ